MTSGDEPTQSQSALRQIAEFILERPDATQAMSITALAAEVAESGTHPVASDVQAQGLDPSSASAMSTG